MADGVIVTLTRDHAYPTRDEQVYRYEKKKDQAPWSGTVAAGINLDAQVWQLLGAPEHIRIVISPF